MKVILMKGISMNKNRVSKKNWIYNFVLMIHLLTQLLGFFAQAKTEKNLVKKSFKKRDSHSQSFNIKGHFFKLKRLPEIILKDEIKIVRTTNQVSPIKPILKLPILTNILSAQTPIIPKIIVPNVKFNPLPKELNVSEWIGRIEKEEQPEWKIPDLKLAEPNINTIESFSENDFRLLEALLLSQITDTTPLSIGLASPLLKIKETKSAALEILGRSLINLKIRTGGMEHLMKLAELEKDTPLARMAVLQALNSLMKNDKNETQFFSTFVQKLKLKDSELQNYSLAQARIAIDEKDLQKAWDTLSHVPAESPQFAEAEFLRAIVQYRSNDLTEAQNKLEGLLQKTENLSKDLKSLSAGTLAQIYFQKGQYKQAYETYRFVDPDHPIWLETLVESAWSQILNKDYEGAAGNMFSLHTNFFKGAYKPESYIVRTVSYLQLCQFGDALSVLTDFLRKYKFAQKQLQNYKQQNPNHLDIIREFLKSGAPKSFAGLPRSLLIEIARDPKFIALQKQLNEVEEDINKMNLMTNKIDEFDMVLLQKQNKYTKLLQDLNGHIKKIQNPLQLEALLNEKSSHERHIQKYTLLRKIVLDAKNGVLFENQLLLPIWNTRKLKIKNEQTLALQDSFINLEKDLSHWLDQSELLFYEIHNGAGEHLRYQMASTNDRRAPASNLNEFKKEDKDQQWTFDGEIWEDEVGHYRSSLKNVCPDNESH